eukprot:10821792-Heterocapsa_arctica.AAC.1
MAQSGSRPIAFCCAAGRESKRWEETKCGAWKAPGIVGADPTQEAAECPAQGNEHGDPETGWAEKINA